MARQINEHIAHEGISNENQSAYRVFHSTEMALLKIQNDIATSMDKGAAVGLVLLDLSAAFVYNRPLNPIQLPSALVWH